MDMETKVRAVSSGQRTQMLESARPTISGCEEAAKLISNIAWGFVPRSKVLLGEFGAVMVYHPQCVVV